MRKPKKLAALFMAAAVALSLPAAACAAVEDTGFSDVAADAWYAEAVAYCQENNVMSGVSATAFQPEGSMTRAMLASVLYRLEGSPAVSGEDGFTDTADGAWYSDAVLWASGQGLVNGYGNGRFGTNDPVSREQLASILWRHAGSPAAEGAAGFSDSASAAAYAAAAIRWAGANQIMRPVSGSLFAPKQDATRAQVADALMRLSRGSAPAQEPAPGGSPHVLVAYFSGTGTTRGVAENLAAGLGSDVARLYEITPEQPYTAADLDYNNSNCRSVREQHDPAARPAISGSVENMEAYDVVFLGYPIWNNDAPRIIYTFLENEALDGKTVIPFCTSGGSSISNSVSNIRGLAGGAAWLDGRRCYSSDTAETLAAWASGLGLGLAAAPDESPAPVPDGNTNVLVAYFSATNTTRPLAEYVADGLGADLYEITPETPYAPADLDYGNSASRTSLEMDDPNSRPAISGSVADMGQYDVVFIGYPIWWGQAPRIVSTFLESNDFSGKTIVPFCTSNSSGIGSSAASLHRLADGADWLYGRRFGSGTSRETMIEWVDSLELGIDAE